MTYTVDSVRELLTEKFFEQEREKAQTSLDQTREEHGEGSELFETAQLVLESAPLPGSRHGYIKLENGLLISFTQVICKDFHQSDEYASAGTRPDTENPDGAFDIRVSTLLPIVGVDQQIEVQSMHFVANDPEKLVERASEGSLVPTFQENAEDFKMMNAYEKSLEQIAEYANNAATLTKEQVIQIAFKIVQAQLTKSPFQSVDARFDIGVPVADVPKSGLS